MESPEPMSEPTEQLDSKAINISENSATPTPISTSSHVTAGVGKYYDTSHPKRGVALIINQVNFNSMDRRDGSDKDRDCIRSAFERIGFDVRISEDPSRNNLLAMLDAVAQEDHSQNSCLVVVVMTHGKKDNFLYAKDKSYEVSKLWEPFIGDSCPSLNGKPKLFFIQACRGKMFDQGVTMAKMSVDETVSVDAAPETISYIIPTMADLLVMYSTYDGHYSWRNPVNGSWFIQSLSIELNANAHSQELLHLLTGVSRRVAYHYQSNVPNNAKQDAMKQMPCMVSTLTKLLCFT